MSLKLKIVDKGKGVIYDGSVEFCEVPAESGIEGILTGHINFISIIKEGIVKYKTEEVTNEISIGGGFIEVSNNFINILVND